MGILDWRLWDRLDRLDRRVGIRPLDSQRSARLVEVLGAVLVALCLVNLLERDWTGAIVNGVLALLLGVWHLWRARRRISDEGGSYPQS